MLSFDSKPAPMTSWAALAFASIVVAVGFKSNLLADKPSTGVPGTSHSYLITGERLFVPMDATICAQNPSNLGLLVDIGLAQIITKSNNLVT